MIFFRLNEDKSITNAVKSGSQFLKGLKNAKTNSEIPTIFIQDSKEVVFVDYIEHPIPLFSDKLKRIVSFYEPDMAYKPVVFVHQKRGQQALYWYFTPPRIDVLSSKSEFHKLGTLKHLIIDGKKAGRSPIFQIEGIQENDLFVHLGLAESILRRDVVGIALQEVEQDNEHFLVYQND